jgi:ATP-dependent DNA helicase RecQ
LVSDAGSFTSSSCRDRDALFAALTEALAESDLDEGEKWRLRSLRRCLLALESRSSPADRGALLRQTASLMDNRVDLPKAGWDLRLDALGSSVLSRFGVTLRSTADRWVAQLLDEGGQRADWPVSLDRSLGLDSKPRRVAEVASADGALHRLSKHPSYRNPTQKAAARALLTMPQGSSLMVSMPTGAGKSLLFQLGALWWRQQDLEHPACVVVIVPTVALALDHARSLQEFRGLEQCRALTGDLGAEEKRQILFDFLRGEIPILVMNPETAFHSARETLERVCQPRTERLGEARAELAAIFIDEAHIIESWGRSFRPDFQRLVSLIQGFRVTQPALRTILLSGTLGDESRALLRRDYGNGEELLEIHACVPRYELDLFARKYEAKSERDRVLFEVLDRLPRPAVIYTTTRDDAEKLLVRLKERAYGAVEQFTGETGPDERTRILSAWQLEGLDLVVATSAFGLGIDKSNVRAVVHACLPEDAARYYQEVGRAGRDGHSALGVCLWTEGDADAAKSTRSKEWLRVESSIERWTELTAAATRQHFDPVTGRRVIDIDVNIAPERLGSHTGERNREWNRTLLNLTQRAGVVKVVNVNPGTNTWTVEVLDPRILDGDEGVLAGVFSLRDDERRQAVAAFDEFREVIQGDLCLLAETFQLIESGRPFASECGRCGPCQKEGQEMPVSVPFGGLKPQWKRPLVSTEAPPMPGVVLIEHDELDFGKLLAEEIPKLARLGYVQFLVPDSRTREAAQRCWAAKHNPGLILGFEELSTYGWSPYDLPTAALIDLGSADVYQQAFLRAQLARPREERPPLVVLVRDRYLLDGRLLSQRVDSSYPLSLLDELVALRRADGDAT